MTITLSLPERVYAKLHGKMGTISIGKSEFILGRRTDNDPLDVDYHLGNTKIYSRQHAKLFYHSPKDIWLISCMGKNGVRLNDLVMNEQTDPVPVVSGDEIYIGDLKFTFERVQEELKEEEIETPKLQPMPVPLYQPTQAPSQPKQLAQLLVRKINRDPYASRQNVILLPDHSQNIDYKTENNEYYIKPPFPFASLIAEAIVSAPGERISLNGIYHYIMDHYAYYRHASTGWQNSVRHNLSVNKAFIKIPRPPGEFGKGNYWTVDKTMIKYPDLPQFIIERYPMQPTKVVQSPAPTPPPTAATSFYRPIAPAPPLPNDGDTYFRPIAPYPPYFTKEASMAAFPSPKDTPNMTADKIPLPPLTTISNILTHKNSFPMPPNEKVKPIQEHLASMLKELN